MMVIDESRFYELREHATERTSYIHGETIIALYRRGDLVATATIDTDGVVYFEEM